MLLKRDPDEAAPANLYVTALPDESYGTSSYIWDVGYASDLLSLMDPVALRTMVERWAISDPHRILNAPYEEPPRVDGGRFYAANGSMFFFSAWNYLHATGDWDALDLDGFFTLSEDRKGGGDEIRYRSRVPFQRGRSCCCRFSPPHEQEDHHHTEEKTMSATRLLGVVMAAVLMTGSALLAAAEADAKTLQRLSLRTGT
jgi:hypothetical protein